MASLQRSTIILFSSAASSSALPRSLRVPGIRGRIFIMNSVPSRAYLRSIVRCSPKISRPGNRGVVVSVTRDAPVSEMFWIHWKSQSHDATASGSACVPSHVIINSCVVDRERMLTSPDLCRTATTCRKVVAVAMATPTTSPSISPSWKGERSGKPMATTSVSSAVATGVSWRHCRIHNHATATIRLLNSASDPSSDSGSTVRRRYKDIGIGEGGGSYSG
jgi:hypothetical protein